MQHAEAPTLVFPPDVMKMSAQVPAMVARGETVPWSLARAHSDGDAKPTSHHVRGCYKLESKVTPCCMVDSPARR